MSLIWFTQTQSPKTLRSISENNQAENTKVAKNTKLQQKHRILRTQGFSGYKGNQNYLRKETTSMPTYTEHDCR